MTTNQEPSDLEEKWRHDSVRSWENAPIDRDQRAYFFRESYVNGYLAARKKAGEEIQALKNRIKELEAIRVITYSECNEKLNKAHSQIQKRDELLERAKIIIDSHQAVTLNPFKWDSCAQWLKQYEELKR